MNVIYTASIHRLTLWNMQATNACSSTKQTRHNDCAETALHLQRACNAFDLEDQPFNKSQRPLRSSVKRNLRSEADYHLPVSGSMSTRSVFPLELSEDKVVSEVKPAFTETKTVAYHPKLPSHVNDSYHADDSISDKETLRQGHDEKPTIMLTVYKKEGLSEQSVFIDTGAGCASCANCERIHGLEDSLKYQLEDYFQGLKREFEAKTGRKWQPRRPWPAELWAWDDGEA